VRDTRSCALRFGVRSVGPLRRQTPPSAGLSGMGKRPSALECVVATAGGNHAVSPGRHSPRLRPLKAETRVRIPLEPLKPGTDRRGDSGLSVGRVHSPYTATSVPCSPVTRPPRRSGSSPGATGTFAPRADGTLPPARNAGSRPLGRGHAVARFRRMLAGIRPLAEADARTSRRAKNLVRQARSQQSSPAERRPRHWTKVH
jgi:hypothetical protein